MAPLTERVLLIDLAPSPPSTTSGVRKCGLCAEAVLPRITVVIRRACGLKIASVALIGILDIRQVRKLRHSSSQLGQY